MNELAFEFSYRKDFDNACFELASSMKDYMIYILLLNVLYK